MDTSAALILVAIITAVPTTLVGVAAIITALGNRRAIAAVHSDVAKVEEKVDLAVKGIDVMNGSTMGELASDDETRRVEAIPFADRTAKEQTHLNEAPEPGPPQGPPR